MRAGLSVSVLRASAAPAERDTELEEAVALARAPLPPDTGEEFPVEPETAEQQAEAREQVAVLEAVYDLLSVELTDETVARLTTDRAAVLADLRAKAYAAVLNLGD